MDLFNVGETQLLLPSACTLTLETLRLYPNETLVDPTDLVSETPVQQFVRFIEYGCLGVPRPKILPLTHVEYSPGCAEYDVKHQISRV